MKSCILAIILSLGVAQAISGIESPSANPLFPEGRIIGGNVATATQFPWQVALQLGLTGGGTSWCGGVLISKDWVLTAAHCLQSVVSVSVRLGSNILEKPQVIVASSSRVTHPNFNAQNLNNNIGVVKLATSVAFSSTIQAIRLPTRSQANTPFTGVVATVSGFGRSSDASPSMSSSLLFTNVTVITNAQCAQVFGNSVVQASTICTRGTKSLSHGICNGDDGSGLVIYEGVVRVPVVIGVDSFVSNRGCSAGDPSGYVRTASYLSWISTITGIPIFN